MARPKKEQKITSSEFKMWLQGVEEMQPKNWSPDSSQWARIRSKIDLISDDIPSVNQKNRIVQSHNSIPENRPPLQKASSSMIPAPNSTPKMTQIPVNPGSVSPVLQTRDTTPANPVKTPDLDTTSEPYKSSFE